ncbi:MAG: MFS transporter, partial [Oscillospiraceae bacterium]|nr:MFS transporter [Oscillospiraceae bacterium]
MSLHHINEESVQTPKIHFGEKFGYLAFSASFNLVYQFKTLYYLFFLTDVLKIGVGRAGIIVVLGTIWDAVNDMVIGYWAANRRFKNGETMRPFILWYSVPWGVTLLLLFTNFRMSSPLTISVSIAIYVVFELFNTIVAIPYNSLGGLATNRNSDRRSINV